MSIPFDTAVLEVEARVELLHGSRSSALELSRTISLKRIADALDKQNEIALGIAQGFPTGLGVE